ncbi:viroplasmin family protein [Ezakiella peruensis]|uniref:ribonuclease H1 domain-containing protein n=1 Tax=Ezakiella peruensis TaxID=1464038 RepID=UPI000C1B10CF|nr:ribonuclease H family protein [Ezakiella peruensis]
MKYYAIKNGRTPGIYTSWDQAKAQVHGYKGAVYKSFKTKEEAENYMIDNNTKNKIISAHEEGEAIVYVDGSYSKDKTYSYGYVIIDGEEETKGSKRFDDPIYQDYRNVAGEVLGTMAAIDKATQMGFEKIYLHYDYTGIRHWALKEWKANNILTQRYRDYFDTIKDKIEVVFVKVDAHTGVEYNEMVDKLAKDAKI